MKYQTRTQVASKRSSRSMTKKKENLLEIDRIKNQKKKFNNLFKTSKTNLIENRIEISVQI
jgi:hypothetical protein